MDAGVATGEASIGGDAGAIAAEIWAGAALDDRGGAGAIAAELWAGAALDAGAGAAGSLGDPPCSFTGRATPGELAVGAGASSQPGSTPASPSPPASSPGDDGFCLRAYATVLSREILDTWGVRLALAMPPGDMRTLRDASKRQCVASPGVHRIQSGTVTSTTSPTERVGRYQLLEPIGIGPSGTVSRAKVFGVAGFERQFAVKRFHAELTATAAMAAMLSAAARAYGSLEHPRIARMSEFGVAQGSTFTAVEYIVGLDALRLIAEARLAGVTLAAGGALALVSQAARAVGYAHGRGLTHLGLAPTNVIITAEGDIKITDFGILSATLPARPIEVPRLANRIPYLAPEQLANEATSAATDVFALGVLAYELITGTRTFRGDTPQQVASAIMAGPPTEPALPRPIVRVLQRCLARSPFERFPDARALADALDAALRVAPVPGTRKDVGAQVKETLDRLAALNDGQMSGVVALYVGTGPIRRMDDPGPSRAHDDPPIDDGDGTSATPAAAYALGRHDAAALPPVGAGPGPVAGPHAGATQPELRYPIATVPGLPPPPIPVPPGVAASGATDVPIAASPGPGAPGAGASTLLGLGRNPTVIPTIRPRPISVAGLPAKPPAIPLQALRAGLRQNADVAPPLQPAAPVAQVDTVSEGVHTLDPNDIESFDNDEPEPEPLAPLEPVAVKPPSTPANEARAELSPRVDPNMADTQPLAPIMLEPLLVDASAPAVELDDSDDRAPTEPLVPALLRSGTTRSRPTVRPSDDEPGRTQAMGSFGPELEVPAPATPANDPRYRTIIGLSAALPRLPAEPAPPLASHDEPGDAPGDDVSDMLNEGFRPGPAQPASTLTWPGDASDGANPETSEAPAAGNTSNGASAYAPNGAQPLAVDGASPPHTESNPVPPSVPRGWTTAPPPHDDAGAAAISGPTAPHRRLTSIVVGVLGAMFAGICVWQIYARVTTPSDQTRLAATSAGDVPRSAPAASDVRPPAPNDTAAHAISPPGDAAIAAEAVPVTAADAARAAVLPIDAARVAGPATDAAGSDAARVAAGAPDAGALRPDPARAAIKPLAPTAPGDTLSIASSPPGARVFLDGSDTGATPLTLPGSPDRHTVALLLAGHDLYIAQVDGHGTFQIPLKEITPTNGPAGIKVLRCKDKDRYYVFIDGKPTGQTCPTERIGCEIGAHTVEVYDIVSETRRKWDIVVKDTRLSFRVRVE